MRVLELTNYLVSSAVWFFFGMYAQDQWNRAVKRDANAR